MYWVYVIWNARHSKYYVGQTEDLGKRLRQRNDAENTLSRYTKRFDGGWMVIHKEEFAARAEAIRRERELKTGKGRDWLKANVLPRKSSVSTRGG
ncbi:MAG: GIY-YIG nuclease family protein [Verrucomicrobiota bacterium]